jgi:hypothetical protein
MAMVGRSKRSKAEIAAAVAAEKKAFEKQRMSRPSKDKIADKKNSNGSNTKPFNVRLIKPDEIIRDKPKAKPAVKVTVKVKPKVTPKPKGLNDYLDKGMTPPSRNKKLPSDADVILKGYNDKKTIAKLKESKKKGKK